MGRRAKNKQGAPTPFIEVSAEGPSPKKLGKRKEVPEGDEQKRSVKKAKQATGKGEAKKTKKNVAGEGMGEGKPTKFSKDAGGRRSKEIEQKKSFAFDDPEDIAEGEGWEDVGDDGEFKAQPRSGNILPSGVWQELS